MGKSRCIQTHKSGVSRGETKTGERSNLIVSCGEGRCVTQTGTGRAAPSTDRMRCPQRAGESSSRPFALRYTVISRRWWWKHDHLTAERHPMQTCVYVCVCVCVCTLAFNTTFLQLDTTTLSCVCSAVAYVSCSWHYYFGGGNVGVSSTYTSDRRLCAACCLPNRLAWRRRDL